MKAEKLKKSVPDILKTFLPELYQLSDLIFQNPEIAYEEVKASNWLSSFLKENGFNVKQNVGNVKTAFKAEKITKTANIDNIFNKSPNVKSLFKKIEVNSNTLAPAQRLIKNFTDKTLALHLSSIYLTKIASVIGT